MKQFHPFYLTTMSPWPLFVSLSSFSLTLSLILMWHFSSFSWISLSLLLLGLVSIFWWRDVFRESSFVGAHNLQVVLGLSWGMVLFIISEIMFFLSFFWSFFHHSLSPNVELGMIWPPKGIYPFNPLEVPLLNTVILLGSGVTVTWCHHSIMSNQLDGAKLSLTLTLVLGVMFTILQGFEYSQASFTFSDSVYGSSFFVMTGFHGLHVIVGSIFLSVALSRIFMKLVSMIHFLSFELSAWYWHFVDVVWLALYTSIYWWGSFFFSLSNSI